MQVIVDQMGDQDLDAASQAIPTAFQL